MIPVQHESSILDWLENTGRLLARETVDVEYPTSGQEEITEFIAEDDNSFDLDDDDDLDLED